ncbi:hypothetical protein [Metasolibacillus fluoroglycofenilyticus]|uniref:hypothetical protein n=1 Tax=Metasolibacillus fluoroglycofenilyticus TaxID=1239396 RepID=UPI000D35F65C|nr:hypothetical protein [Metasolibacillus fluoroglycofenilyticus]
MVWHYISSKLAAAGFALSIIFGYLLVITNFNLYEFSEAARSWTLWAILFGYGIIITCIIDAVIEKWQQITRYKNALYILAGFLFFLPFGLSIFTFIAGVTGALVAGIFLGGQTIAKNSKAFNIAFIALPLLLLIMIQFDFTTKKDWQETITENTFDVTYQYFNGQHKIPLKLEKGDIVTFEVVIHFGNGGGGYSFQNAQGHPIGQEELGANRYQVEIQKDGTYYIVLTGNRAAGEATVEWEIK